MKTLDEINASFKGLGFYLDEPNERRVGPYRVFFSGFMAAQQNLCLIGHIQAWPAEKIADPHFFVGVIRGKGWGRYEPGAYFDIRPNAQDVRHFRSHDFETEDGMESAKRAISLGIDVISDMVAADLAGRPVPILPTVRWIPVDPQTGVHLGDDQLSDAVRG